MAWLGIILVALPFAASALHDPTAPPTTVAKSTSPNVFIYEVTMIVGRSDNRKAMVNEKFVGVNDTVDNAKIIAINSDSVVLRKDGKVIKAFMPGANVRR